MAFEKPVYQIRSRSGEVLGPYSFEEVMAQLRDKKVSDDADIRRIGWEVIEKDELWGKVRDFPVFGHSGPAGRHEAYALAKRARLSWAISLSALAVSGAVFLLLFFLPYQESHRLSAAAEKAKAEAEGMRKDAIQRQTEADQKFLKIDDVVRSKLMEAEKSFQVRISEVRQELAASKASDASARKDLASQDAKLKQAARERRSLAEEAEKIRSELAAVQARNSDLEATFEKRVGEAQAQLQAQYATMTDRLNGSGASAPDFLRVPSNPNVARVLPSDKAGEGKLVIVIAKRPPQGSLLELFDGSRTLRVRLDAQTFSPPMTVVDVLPGQSLILNSFLGLEVLVRVIE